MGNWMGTEQRHVAPGYFSHLENKHFFFKFFILYWLYCIFILINNVVIVSGEWQSDSAIYIYLFSPKPPPIQAAT